MLALDDARARVLASIGPATPTEACPLEQAVGRYLAEAAVAATANPAFDNSAMDGFALRTADLPEGGGSLPVALLVAAGDTPGDLPAGACARIMTGAPVPAGADAVVMQEKVSVAGDSAHFEARPPVGDNIRRAGEDFAVGERLAEPGSRLSALLVGSLAAAGVATVPTHRPPRVLLLATGSELRQPGEALAPGQIYDSNRSLLAPLLRELGAEVTEAGPVPDEPEALGAAFDRAAEYDVVVTSGGVSVGELDHVKSLLEQRGEIGFWKAALKPGKPFAFGRLGEADFFGLPGNPLSALITFRQFVAPAIIQRQGGTWRPERLPAEAGADFQRRATERTEFLCARLQSAGGRLIATPLPQQGSGRVGNLAATDGFIVLEADSTGFREGDPVQVERA